nr:hypothetical protein [Spirochaeta sp.]
ELRWYRSCSLDHLPLTGRDRERLALLGLRRVGDLLAIREEQLGARFSPQLREVHRFLRRATGDLAVRDAVEPSTGSDAQGNYEPPLRSSGALLSACMQLVQRLLPELTEQGQWIRHLRLSCTDDRQQQYTEAIECGHLTRDSDYLERLIALRLENRSWRAREITAIALSMGTENADTRQKTLDDLFEESPSGDTDRIDETLAYIRAQLGNERVFCMRLHPGRLPEHRYRREAIASLRELPAPHERPGDRGAGAPTVTRIRRIRAAGPAPFRSRVPPLSYGPFVQAGEWWDRDETDRIYSYHRRNGGEMLWLYRPARGGPWMLQGYLS